MEVLLHAGTRIVGKDIHETIVLSYGIDPRLNRLNQLRYDIAK